MMKTKIIIAFALLVGVTSVMAQGNDSVWSLRDCIDYALKNNIQLQRSRISRLSAEEDVLQSQAALLPSLNASTSQNVAYRPWVASGMSTVAHGYVQSSVD